MKKILISFSFLIFILAGCSNSEQTPVGGNLKSDENESSTINSSNNEEVIFEKLSTETSENTKTEEKISEYSTKIYDKDKERQNNLEITCSKLNEHVVKSGETFSFEDTVGKATSNEGFQKAKIFDKKGNVKEGYGGGKCQVSTTVFNAVRKIPGIEIKERHNHSNKVPYAKAGDDAAVAHGGYDFKFLNNNNFDIKILATTDKNNVTIVINKIT